MQFAISSTGRRTPAPEVSSDPRLPTGQAIRSGNSNKDVDKIIKSFNTWSFKREQPSDIQLLYEFVACRVHQALPISFILYWGKGPRNKIAKSDTQCLDYLNLFKKRIEDQYAHGTEIIVCFTDTHARHNGHDEDSIRSYYESISFETDRRAFATTWLSELVKRHGAVVEPNEVTDLEILDDLESCAAKWYRGDGDAEHGARVYFSMNMIERRAIASSFPRSIFITFNGSRYRTLFPAELPIFYMYSLKKGTSVKPWFIDSSGQAYDEAADRCPINDWQ